MKLKPFVFPIIYLSLIFLLVFGLYFTNKTLNQNNNESLNNVKYVSSVILNDTIPVANTNNMIGNPYLNETVSIKRYYYNIEDDIDKQKESLIYYDNTYLPNTGVDYVSSDNFDVVAISDGSVIDIKEDEMLGKIVEIRHDKNIISSYAGLSEISVQKGQVVSQGSKIGISGTNKINEEIGNHLHFEIYQNGVNVDPLKIIGKNLDDF